MLVRQRTDAPGAPGHAAQQAHSAPRIRKHSMSKGQKGNKEAKKPKKGANRPLSPEATAPASVPAVAERQKKR